MALPTKNLFLGLILMEIHSMTQKLACLLLLVAAASSVSLAQSAEKRKGRPDIPGTFLIDLGVNRLIKAPNDLKYGLWGSRTINTYYLYDMRIGKSKFSFHPGIGLGMEHFKLQSFNQYLPNDTIKRLNPTLILDSDGNTAFINGGNYLYDGDTLKQVTYPATLGIKKSLLALTYVDVPFEFRFSTNPDDPSRSFKAAIGGRVGYLLGSHTKMKYKENGEFKKLKNEQNFNLSPFRYSVSLRIYIGNFNFFGYYNLNPLFKEDKGPMKTKTNSFTVGFSLAGF